MAPGVCSIFNTNAKRVVVYGMAYSDGRLANMMASISAKNLPLSPATSHMSTLGDHQCVAWLVAGAGCRSLIRTAMSELA